jgi:hypothetical protein
MKAYTLEQINNIIQNRCYSKEHFTHLFSIFGYNGKEVEKFWEVYATFPRVREEDYEIAELVIDKILEIPKVETPWNIHHSPKVSKKKIYYNHENRVCNFEIDLNDLKEVMLYADFLKQNPEIIGIVDFIEELGYREKRLAVYDGDVFSTSDSWHRDRDGELIVCDQGTYRRLLYTKGKGYIRNRKPDYDDGEYSSYVVTGKDRWFKIGNLYVDASFLVEGGEADDD